MAQGEGGRHLGPRLWGRRCGPRLALWGSQEADTGPLGFQHSCWSRGPLNLSRRHQTVLLSAVPLQDPPNRHYKNKGRAEGAGARDDVEARTGGRGAGLQLPAPHPGWGGGWDPPPSLLRAPRPSSLSGLQVTLAP